MKTNALSSFLQSSLNVELVYILLQSITEFSKKSKDHSGFTVKDINPYARKGSRVQNATVNPINLQARDIDIIQQCRD